MTTPEPTPPALSLSEVSVYTHTVAAVPSGKLPTVAEAVRAWREAARSDGWRPVGLPAVDLVWEDGTQRARRQVHGYVARQRNLKEITHREPIEQPGNLAEDRARAVARWESAVRAMDRVPVGRLSAAWRPAEVLGDVPAWEVTGMTRPRDAGDVQPGRGTVWKHVVVALRPSATVEGQWEGVLPDVSRAVGVPDVIVGGSIAEVVTILVEQYRFAPGVEVHLGVDDEYAATVADEVCGRPAWVGEPPSIDVAACALPQGHAVPCLPSVTDVQQQIARAAEAPDVVS